MDNQLLEEEREKIKIKIDQLEAKQLSIKIFINSIYGYFGNKHAPFGDDDIASSITLTGQAVIKQSAEISKQFVSTRTGITDPGILNNICLYSDTDSVYLSLYEGIKKMGTSFTTEDGKISPEIYEIVIELENHLNSEIQKWGSKAFNSKDCRFVFKREIIADTGIFLTKKRYIIRILDDEGIPTNKFKYKGVEVVRSTMPSAVKPYVKNITETMLKTRDLKETNNVINKIYKIYKSLDYNSISTVSNINDYNKYASKCNRFNTIKGMPIHVKAAYFHNLLLDELNIASKYEKINSGDKVRYFYVQQPNKYKLQVIGFKYEFPKEFEELFPINYELMFEKTIYSAIERLYSNVNWKLQKPGSITKTNLIEFLS